MSKCEDSSVFISLSKMVDHFTFTWFFPFLKRKKTTFSIYSYKCLPAKKTFPAIDFVPPGFKRAISFKNVTRAFCKWACHHLFSLCCSFTCLIYFCDLLSSEINHPINRVINEQKVSHCFVIGFDFFHFLSSFFSLFRFDGKTKLEFSWSQLFLSYFMFESYFYSFA